MSCDPVCTTDLIKIVKGTSQRIIASILNCDDTPYDLSGMEGASAFFKSTTDGSPVVKTFAASGIVFPKDEVLGKLEIILTASDTDLFYEGDEQTWVLYVDMPSGIFNKVVYEESLSVFIDPVSEF